MVSKYYVSYVLMMLGSAALSFAKLFVFSALLGVDEFGLYSLVLSTHIYIMYCGGLGLNEAQLKLGSRAHGAADDETGPVLRDTGMALGGLGIVGAGVAVYLIALQAGDAEVSRVVALGCLLAVTTFEFNAVANGLRTQQRFNAVAALLITKNAIVVALGAAAARVAGVELVVVVESLVFLGVGALCLLREGWPPLGARLRAGTRKLREALAVGLPLTANNAVRSVTYWVDRWAIAYSLGNVAVGHFSFAMILVQGALVASNLLGTILLPRWLARSGPSGTVREPAKEAFFAVVAILAVFLAGSPIVVFGTPLVFEYVYSDYAAARELIYFAYAAAGFALIGAVFEWLCVVRGREKAMLAVTAVATCGFVAGLGVGVVYSLPLIYYGYLAVAVRVLMMLGHGALSMRVLETGQTSH